MQYLIDTTTNTVVAVLGDLTCTYELPPNYIIRSGDYGTEYDKLYYDPKTDSIKEYTPEQYLEQVKETKLAQLRAQIQSEFPDVNDMMADLVKALKLIIQYCLAPDDNTRNSVADFLKITLKELNLLYPDDYARHCVARYISLLVSKLPEYYKAKEEVEKAQTVQEVEAITLD
ncbi:MAG: hypothetical protein GXO10_02950 [Crenarchaeota archaeon]|nr:hypothetical protein [Thermoproteota archaeon]